MSRTVAEVETGGSSRHDELEQIEEERKQSESREPSMAGSEHRSNSNKSVSEEETKGDSISTVSIQNV